MKRVRDRVERSRAARAGVGPSAAISSPSLASDTNQLSLAELAAAGSAAYDRERHLGRLIPLWPAEIADTSTAGRARIAARLRRALRAERARGKAGHWTYDLNRHIALALALKAETADLDRISNQKSKPDQHNLAQQSLD